jgi:hypothetical protein
MNRNAPITATAADQDPLSHVQTFFIVRDFQPGQLIRVVFLTVEQSQNLPAIPPTALQIAVAPGGIHYVP